ncbi:MAG: nucleotide exchange factor GrpE [Oligosphaeraceae bacterium]
MTTEEQHKQEQQTTEQQTTEQQTAPQEPATDEAQQQQQPQPEAVEAQPAAEAEPQPEAIDYDAKIAELEDKYLRCRAEFDNYRKRMAREFGETRDAARRNTVSDFLTVYDYFAMGMATIDTAPNLDILKQGMTMIWNEFQKVLEGLGVKAVDSVGKPFDVKLHEAASREASDTVPEGTILREWKKAFMLGDKLLRPAVVVVSAGPAAPAQPTAEDADGASAEQPAEGAETTAQG